MNRNYLASASIGLFLGCTAGALAAPVGPTAGYEIDPKYTSTSPDSTTTIDQYAKIDADGDYVRQFWARHQDKLTLLKPDQPDYRAGFRFTTDSRWLVRMQKNRRRICQSISVPFGSTGVRGRHSETAQRPRLGLFQEPSRFPKGHEAKLSHRGGSPEGNRRELSLDGRDLAR
jgi:hypothetical protein